MISEVLFRGKRKYAGSKPPWVYGYYWENAAGDSFIKQTGNGPSVEVIKETCGQYIGVEDKNCIRIFEGDIIKLDEGVKNTFNIDDGVILYDHGTFMIDPGDHEYKLIRSVTCSTDINYILRGMVVGNIWDTVPSVERK